MAIVSPSLLAANFLELRSEIEMLNSSDAEWIHFDVMDGVFVPNISFGLPILKQTRAITDKVLDVHLMIVNPDNYIEAFKEAGADILTIHYEASVHLHRSIQKIKSLGMKAGVALNPHTPISNLESIIEDLDLVLLMSVNPGYGGQKFIPSCCDKVRDLKAMINRKGCSTIIEIDGGIDNDTCKLVVEAGADAVVAGSFVFGSDSPSEAIEGLAKI